LGAHIVSSNYYFCSNVGDVPQPKTEELKGTEGSWADHYGMAAMYLRLNGLVPLTAKQEEKK
jgi:hypothetical protein